ncbi:MAG TPA: hypothetical protein VG053_12425 [Solirubrobacteraceae bacterium]|jgi:hypothetical protein|nr:hypothetical protein [Solirubrobacteraceae bacterium]
MVNSASRRLAGLTVFAAIALGCALPQAASASSVVWQLNGNQAKAATEVTSKATLKFSDQHGGLFGEKIKLECKVAGKGSVGPGATDEVSQWTVTECATREGNCPSSAVTALNLPWHSELALVEGKMRDVLSSGGGGAPGYKSTCSGALEDKCTGNTSMAVENVAGGVDVVFDSKSEKLNCTRGGSGSGAIEEAELIKSPASGTLTAGAPGGWLINGVLVPQAEAVTSSSSGTLTFYNHDGGPFGEDVKIECAAAGEGNVGPEVAGEVTKWTATECHRSLGTCSSPTVKALHLPWHTELVAVEGAKRDMIESGGSGTPEYEVTCEGGFGYKCSWNASTATENVSGGVDAILGDLSEERKCSRGDGLAIKGTELISDSGYTLTVR